MNNERIKNTGFLFLTILLSTAVLYAFFGTVLEDPFSTFFSKDGDGLQVYFSSAYHVKYDVHYWHQSAVNYPYGESVFFTACQPMVTNILLLLKPVIDLSDNVIGIINFIMLISIVASAVFLYLIFRALQLPGFYSSMAATAIAFLSPQIGRLGGHFTLTYQFAIPCFIYLLICFYKKPSLWLSFVIALLTFFMGGTHIYFFAFFALLLLFFWVGLYRLNYAHFRNKLFIAKHVFIQFLLPFIILQILLKISSDVHDRTATPWGYLNYTSSPAGVFFPYGKPYEFIVRMFCNPRGGEWEGVAHVGLAATILCIVLLFLFFKNSVQKKLSYNKTVVDEPLLNIFFWGAVASLLISFGWPFALGLQRLLDYMGFIKQFRGIARFAWNFFYIINIVTVYIVYKRFAHSPRKAYTAQVALIIFLCMDAYGNSNGAENNLNNAKLTWLDKDNEMPENIWIKKVNMSKYQALMPLPYFHIGSENIMIEPKGEIRNWVYEVSIKTGLPIFAVSASRTSLSQTYSSISLVMEPLMEFPFLKVIDSNKPFLIICDVQNIGENEKRIIAVSDTVCTTPRYRVYSCTAAKLKSISQNYCNAIKAKADSLKAICFNNLLSDDSLKRFVFEGYESNKNETAIDGRGSYIGDLGNWNTIFEGTIPNIIPDTNYMVSVWMYNFKKDLYPRSSVIVDLQDSAGKSYQTDYTMPMAILKTMYNNWALLEYSFRFKHKSDKLKFTIRNKELIGANNVAFDNFMIRPSFTNIYYRTNSFLVFNNRIISLAKK